MRGPVGRSDLLRTGGLYAILDPAVVAGAGGPSEEALDGALSEALAGGCRIVQYRDKTSPGGRLVERATRFARACRETGALFLVNDRLDAALISGADGCHLGQDDLPLPAARRIAPPGFLLGVSTHDPGEARRAQEEGADYIGAGAVFRTGSKENASPPGGIPLVRRVSSAVRIPVVAIGGITRENVRDVLRAGASAFAVISDLFGGPDTRGRAEEFLRIWRRESAP